ncbi:hypothetical protein DBR46_22555 [Pseudomonas sp. KBW05]|nr:hypothetical protein DBR46_22555 [Pseudomonas sp. KBW05]
MTLWRGSLLPLGREAAPKSGSATHSSGSKLPRHSGSQAVQGWLLKRAASFTGGKPNSRAYSRLNCEALS